MKTLWRVDGDKITSIRYMSSYLLVAKKKIKKVLRDEKKKCLFLYENIVIRVQ